MLSSEYITIDGNNIKYVIAGTHGGTILMLHGLGSSSRYFAPLMRELAVNHIVIAPDQPSFGKSEDRREKLDVPKLAKFYLKFIKQMRIKDHTLVANSLGTQISIEMVTKHANNCKAIVLINPTVNPHERSTFKQIARLIQSSAFEPFKEIKIQLRAFKQAGIVRLVRTLRHTLNDEIETKLPFVKQPTLIIRGENDSVCPQYWAEEATALIPDANLHVINNASHGAHYSHPKETAQLINALLKRL